MAIMYVRTLAFAHHLMKQMTSVGVLIHTPYDKTAKDYVSFE